MALVRSEDQGPVRHIVLDRADKRNAMSNALLRELADALRDAERDGDVRCIVLRGEGPVFSAGVDLGELASLGQGDGAASSLRPFRRDFLDVANLCEEIAKPVICRIHGACIGGALEVALGCDLRVMASDAQVGVPEVRFGLIPDVGGCSRLPAVVGLGRAKELVMTGRLIGADEAQRIGLANRVADPERLDEALGELVEALLAVSPVAVGHAKRVLDAAAKPALAQTLEHEVVAQEACVAALRAQQEAASLAS